MEAFNAPPNRNLLGTRNVIISGESWMGLETLHQLTSNGDYGLNITMTDFDDQSYFAIYDEIEVTTVVRDDNCKNKNFGAGWCRRRIHIDGERLQRCPIYPQRLNARFFPWAEVQRKVREPVKCSIAKIFCKVHHIPCS